MTDGHQQRPGQRWRSSEVQTELVKYFTAMVTAVAGILLGIYSAAIILTARGHAAAMPSRYRSMDEISNVHDSYYTSRLWGIVELKTSIGNSALSVGDMRVPLPASEIVGWTTAALATILLLGSVYLAVRALRTVRIANRAC